MENWPKLSLKILIFLFLFLPNFIFLSAQTPLPIPQDIFIAAVVQPWLYLEVSLLDLTLSPDLVSPEGIFNIGESPEIIFKVGTNNAGGWQIKIKGKNGGLKSQATGYKIPTVNVTSTLEIKKEGFGAQATTSLAGVIINPIYNFYGTDIVGEVPSEYRLLVMKHSPNAFVEVAKMKIKASASPMTPAGLDYTEEIISTIIPLI